jgi:hypothetical protein
MMLHGHMRHRFDRAVTVADQSRKAIAARDVTA